MQAWQMQDAKARLSELVKMAETAPQDITVHGRSVAVVVSRAQFNRLSGQQASLLEFMQASPLFGLEEEVLLDRDGSLTREVNL
jgi:prevent-host-death family protein